MRLVLKLTISIIKLSMIVRKTAMFGSEVPKDHFQLLKRANLQYMVISLTRRLSPGYIKRFISSMGHTVIKLTSQTHICKINNVHSFRSKYARYETDIAITLGKHLKRTDTGRCDDISSHYISINCVYNSVHPYMSFSFNLLHHCVFSRFH